MNDTTCGSSALQDRPTKQFQLGKSYTHARFLLRCTRRELLALQRLSEILPSTFLVSEPWRLLLMTLVENLGGDPAYSNDLAERCGMSTEIALRYLRILESDRLVLLGDPGPKGHSVCMGDEGVLRIVRYFLPESANE